MNRFGLYVAGLFLSVIGLTSCMKGSNVTEGWACGVVGYGNKNFFNIVLKTQIGDFYSTSLNSSDLMEGDCCVFYYRLDGDAPENSANAIEVNGYYTISLLQLERLQKFPLSFAFDLSTVLEGEVPVLRGYFAGDYVHNHLFITHIVNQPSDMELNWILGETAMPTIDDSGRRYYDLYVRATVKKEGTTSVKTDTQHMVAYSIYSYLSNAASTERSLLGSNYNAASSNFTLRFFYVSSIDEETNTITWQSDSEEVPVAYFLPGI